MFFISPILCLTALARPYIGLLSLVMMYYFRPPIWAAPTWFRPQMWLTAAIGIGWLAQARVIKFPPLMKMAAIIVLLCFFNAFFAVDDRKTSVDAAQIILKLVVVMLFTVNLVDTPKKFRWFLWANVLGMIYNLKAIFVQGFEGSSVSAERVDVGVGQGGGANYIAMILTMTLPFLYVRILNGRKWERWACAGLAAMYVMGIVVTGSRGGFLSLGAVVLYMLFRSNRKVLGAFILGCLLVIFAILIPTQSVERFKQGVGVEGQRDTSAESRIKLWKAAITMFLERPVLGVGLDNYQRISPRYVGVFASKGELKYEPGMKGRGFVTHSTWFQTLAEGGLLIAIPFFLMFLVTAVTLRRVRRAPLPPGVREFYGESALVLEGIFVAFVVSSTFGSHFKIDFMWWYFGAVAALKLLADAQVRSLFAAARGERRAAALQGRVPAAAP
jgi:O-antigen ligase